MKGKCYKFLSLRKGLVGGGWGVQGGGGMTLSDFVSQINTYSCCFTGSQGGLSSLCSSVVVTVETQTALAVTGPHCVLSQWKHRQRWLLLGLSLCASY